MKNWKLVLVVAVLAIGLFSTAWYLYQQKKNKQAQLDEIALKATPEEKFNRQVKIQNS